MLFHSVRTKILASILATTLLFAVTMVVFAETVIQDRLIEELSEKGVAIARKVAADSVNSIITERYFEVEMTFQDLLASEADILYAFVLGEDGRELAHTFSGGIPPQLKGAHPVGGSVRSSTRELATDRGTVLDVAVPLLRGEIGVLHMGFSESAIHKDVDGIVLLIMLCAGLSLLAGGAAAIGFSRFITRPLLKLTQAAERFGHGDAHEPVEIASGDEVGELAQVFNTMVEKRRQVEEERERLIKELRRTLTEVKILRGFLPICSACKKIRDDAGYWQQLESYIREHTEAEFSHSLCPDCAKSLYPDIWKTLRGETSDD